MCPACGEPVENKVRHLGYELRCCSSCGLWFWPDRSPADYEAVYEMAEYEEAQISPLKRRAGAREFLSHPTYAPFFAQVPRKDGGTLLDVGCGVGRFLVAARSVGWKTRGIDISRRAVEIGRDTEGLDLSCETLEELKQAGERFDAVCAFEVLEHVQQPIDFVRSAMSVLADGGWFFCTVPNRESPTVLGTVRPDWLPPIHLQFFTQASLRMVLGRSGSSDIRTGMIVTEVGPKGPQGRVGTILSRMLGRGERDPVGIWGMARRA